MMINLRDHFIHRNPDLAKVQIGFKVKSMEDERASFNKHY
jgi:hypothetical protein